MNIDQKYPNVMPSIAKYAQNHWDSIQSHYLNRHAIGFIVKGTKYIYYGDVRKEVGRGDIFYLSSGTHYTEDVPDATKSFEQIIVYFTTEQLSRILSQLTMGYGMILSNDHVCDNCRGKSQVICSGWNHIRTFFSSLNQSIKEGLFKEDPQAEMLKMTELIFLLFSHQDCCIKNKIMEHTDEMKESFEQTMYRNIFKDVSIEDLAKECNRSLTSFKKEFRRHFHEPPHKWFIRQRLMHSRLLLISTQKSISEIGVECNFPNTSHFIKLFKKEYELTPAGYRNRHKEKELSRPKTLAN